MPDVNGIDWIKVKSARSAGVAQEGVKGNKVQKRVDKDGTVLPLFVQFDRLSFSLRFRGEGTLKWFFW